MPNRISNCVFESFEVTEERNHAQIHLVLDFRHSRAWSNIAKKNQFKVLKMFCQTALGKLNPIFVFNISNLKEIQFSMPLCIVVQHSVGQNCSAVQHGVRQNSAAQPMILHVQKFGRVSCPLEKFKTLLLQGILFKKAESTIEKQQQLRDASI